VWSEDGTDGVGLRSPVLDGSLGVVDAVMLVDRDGEALTCVMFVAWGWFKLDESDATAGREDGSQASDSAIGACFVHHLAYADAPRSKDDTG
jgi:hypothetical protein